MKNHKLVIKMKEMSKVKENRNIREIGKSEGK